MEKRKWYELIRSKMPKWLTYVPNLCSETKPKGCAMMSRKTTNTFLNSVFTLWLQHYPFFPRMQFSTQWCDCWSRENGRCLVIGGFGENIIPLLSILEMQQSLIGSDTSTIFWNRKNRKKKKTRTQNTRNRQNLFLPIFRVLKSFRRQKTSKSVTLCVAFFLLLLLWKFERSGTDH